MSRGIFITAAGTGVGKTLTTSALAWQLARAGRAVLALKPVVSGFSAEDLDSDPAVLLRAVGRAPTQEAIAAIAPWRFQTALSPDRAARLEGRPIQFVDVVAFCRQALDSDHDHVLIEGAGGVMSPIDGTRTSLDLVVQLQLPVVLVVGTYLGSLSHALTAFKVLEISGVAIRAIVVSDSTDGVGLAEAAATIAAVAPPAVEILPLPRLAGAEVEKWRCAPDLTHLCQPAGRRS